MNFSTPTQRVVNSPSLVSHAIVMRRFGPPDVLVVEDCALPPLAAGEARVRVLAAAVNHSDLRVRAGDWPIRKPSPFPYVPGLEAVGEVVEVASDVATVRVGDRAWTTMQGRRRARRARRRRRQHITSPRRTSHRCPPRRSRFASPHRPGPRTAINRCAGFELAALRGKTLAISGATGGVGAVAVEIGEGARRRRRRGRARRGAARRQRRCSARRRRRAAVRLAGRGAAAGRSLLHVRRGRRRPRSRSTRGACSTVARSPAIRRKISDGDALRAATRALLALPLPAPPTTVLPLADAARAHDLVERRAVHGRVVLVPA